MNSNSTITARFTFSVPYKIEANNDIGMPYDITLYNAGPDPIIADSFKVMFDLGEYGHPMENSAFVYTINNQLVPDAYAMAVPVSDEGYTTQIKIGYAANVPDEQKQLAVGEYMVVRFLSTEGYEDEYMVLIDASLVIVPNA